MISSVLTRLASFPHYFDAANIEELIA